MNEKTLYLSSLDSARFELVRECSFQRDLLFDTGKLVIEARISPPVVGQDFNRRCDIERVILSARHEDVSLDAISSFPCFVFICVPRVENLALESPIQHDDLEIIGWGELYRTASDARRHVFD